MCLRTKVHTVGNHVNIGIFEESCRMVEVKNSMARCWLEFEANFDDPEHCIWDSVERCSKFYGAECDIEKLKKEYLKMRKLISEQVEE